MATLSAISQVGLNSDITHSGTAVVQNSDSDLVLEVIASANTGDYVYSSTNANSTNTADVPFNWPADFDNPSSATSLSVRLQYALQSGTRTNTWSSLEATLVDSGGSALSDTVTLATNITTTTPTNSSVVNFTGLNTTAGQSVWLGAQLRISITISKSMGGDTLEKQVFAAEVTGTYDAAVAVTGSMAATESGADTFAASGTVTDPAITGTFAATETGADTAAATGDVLVQGSGAATETGADTAAATGTILVQGSLAATETGADTAAATGTVLVEGTGAATETGADTLAATGTVTDPAITGTFAATETGSDALAASGVVLVQGSGAFVESGADLAASTGTVLVQGSLAATETGTDTLLASGGAVSTGTFAAIETGSDTAASTGGVLVQGAGAATETGVDTLFATGGAVAIGDMAATETGADTLAATGTVSWEPIVGTVAIVEAIDTASVYGQVIVQGTLIASDLNDSASAAGKVYVTGDFAVTEENDTFFAEYVYLGRLIDLSANRSENMVDNQTITLATNDNLLMISNVQRTMSGNRTETIER